VLTAANYRGIGKTALLTRVLVVATLAVLGLVVVLALTGGSTTPDHLDGWASAGPYDVLQAAGLLFFAFAGYARIATLGEEVRDPARAIPRAILIALAVVVAVYVAVGVSVLLASGPDAIADSTAPLATAVDLAGAAWAEPLVRVGAAVASLGALLVLIAGVGRTSLAMAREGDLPRVLDAVHPRFRVPYHAELAVAAVVGVLVLTVDLRGVIGFSSFGVLTYYAIANASAYTQPAEQRRWSRGWNVLGLAGCAVLAVTLPPSAVAIGIGMFAVGLTGRWIVRRRRAQL
jgi:basic amino acid/polyamine antiporter, APA family